MASLTPATLRSRFLPVAISFVVVLACNLARTPAGPSTPLSSSRSGIPVSATPIRLVIPSGLATGASAETIDVVTDQTGAPWDVAPAHLLLTFQGYALQGSFYVPQLFDYPASQYSSLNPAAAESLKRLGAVLSKPSASQDQATLPHVPFFNAGQAFAAHEKIIRFSGGSGVRFVTQYGQDVSPINNSGLFYHFQGLSQDGRNYIVAVLPVNLPFLPADNNPDSPVPSGGIPFPPSGAAGPNYEDYFKQVTDRINAAPADQFNPSLDTLDQLVQSISVEP